MRKTAIKSSLAWRWVSSFGGLTLALVSRISSQIKVAPHPPHWAKKGNSPGLVSSLANMRPLCSRNIRLVALMSVSKDLLVPIDASHFSTSAKKNNPNTKMHRWDIVKGMEERFILVCSFRKKIVAINLVLEKYHCRLPGVWLMFHFKV